MLLQISGAVVEAGVVEARFCRKCQREKANESSSWLGCKWHMYQQATRAMPFGCDTGRLLHQLLDSSSHSPITCLRLLDPRDVLPALRFGFIDCDTGRSARGLAGRANPKRAVAGRPLLDRPDLLSIGLQGGRGSETVQLTNRNGTIRMGSPITGACMSFGYQDSEKQSWKMRAGEVDTGQRATHWPVADGSGRIAAGNWLVARAHQGEILRNSTAHKHCVRQLTFDPSISDIF